MPISIIYEWIMFNLIECSRCEYGHAAFIETVRTLSWCHGQIDSEQEFGSRRIQIDWQRQFTRAMLRWTNPVTKKKSISVQRSRIDEENVVMTHLTHFNSVNGKSVIIVDVNSNWLFLQWAPCNLRPLTPKLLSFWLASPPPCSVIVTSSASSSSDQLFACATHWRVAVM